MYKKWTIKDIKEELNDIGIKLDYPTNLSIEISIRATRRMGAFFYRRENETIVPIKFVFARKLIDGNYPEDVVREVIIHEYLHYYCDTKTGVSNGHNKFFKAMCLKCGITNKATFNYKNINGYRPEENAKIYNIYCGKCYKLVCIHKRRDAAERKVKGYISKCCNYRLVYKLNNI